MASHGGLALAQEALGTQLECASTKSGRRKIMLTLGLVLLATGLVALSLECVGVTAVFFVIAATLIRFA
jgi:hypothetical protein